FFFSSRRRHTRSYGDWSSDVCSSDLSREPLEWFSASQGGVLCRECAEHDAGRVSPPAIKWLDDLSRVDLLGAGDMTPDAEIRREIGRASCRERVSMWGVEGVVERKST